MMPLFIMVRCSRALLQGGVERCVVIGAQLHGSCGLLMDHVPCDCLQVWDLKQMPPMETWCQLFLRKFSAQAANKLITIFTEGVPGLSWT